ncbi:AcrR family transcriptional regulator [Kineococcus radiotolerans]|uniref:AcrR family transcriptional regulator n=1 Tax=Kineococcus radiotolerans TaxID=131568 RepID=A0A7W4XZI5_KINRA|nr:TetR/AcrR family transcriptional regulator [Kineococcus radiotolerans]MBB2903375.1 AcrR family transcriptional regulator [Kineococcus radiotolerans]
MTTVMETTTNPPNPPTPLTPRERLVASARDLIQERGVHGVGLREIVTHADAPRGSLQHYFPGGKDQLVAEALTQADALARRSVRQARTEGTAPADALRTVLSGWREQLQQEHFRRGCPYAATVVDTSAGNETLRTAASQQLHAWHEDFTAVLQQSGLPEARARSLAALVQSSIQGALLLARAHHSTQPLDDVEIELVPLLEALTAHRA